MCGSGSFNSNSAPPSRSHARCDPFLVLVNGCSHSGNPMTLALQTSWLRIHRKRAEDSRTRLDEAGTDLHAFSGVVRSRGRTTSQPDESNLQPLPSPH